MDDKPLFSRSSDEFEGFTPLITVATCFTYHGTNLLLLRRAEKSREGGKWAVPGGKQERSEDARGAMVREMHEELNWRVDPNSLTHRARLYERIPKYGDYIIEVFHLVTKCPDAIQLNPREHSEFQWISYKEIQFVDLMAGQLDLYLEIYGDEHGMQ